MTSSQIRSPPPTKVAPTKPKTNAKKSNRLTSLSLFNMTKQYQINMKRSRRHLKMPPMLETMRVLIRFRPVTKDEKLRETKKKSSPKQMKMNIMNNNLTHELKIQDIQNGKLGRMRKFMFNDILPANVSQYETFQRVAEQTCDDILQGYNGTILAYGQTGSGKTHSMYGPENKKKKTREDLGIIHQSFAYIFETLNNPCSEICTGKLEHRVLCEFIEIYNGQLKDLLDPMARPSIHEYPDKNGIFRAILKSVQRVEVHNMQEAIRYIQQAIRNRTSAGTAKNVTSARSHMILRMIVIIETADGRRTGVGNFVDLAGSESMKIAGKETAKVLNSIQTLQNVISTLAQGKNNAPFKDSKLTFFLKNSLVGNCKTTFLINASPHIYNRSETIQSLVFGEYCNSVQNSAVINEVRTKGQLIKDNEALVQEIRKLRKNKLKSKDIALDANKAMENENAELQLQIEALLVVNKSTGRILMNTIEKKLALEERELQMTSDQLNFEYDIKNIRNNLEMQAMKKLESEQKLYEIEEAKQDLQSKYEILLDNKELLSQENDTLVIEIERLKESSFQQIEKIGKLDNERNLMSNEMMKLRQQMLSELEQNRNKVDVEVQKASSLDNAIASLTQELENYNSKIGLLNIEMQEKCEIIDKLQLNVHSLEDEQRRISLQLENEHKNNIQLVSKTEQKQEENERLQSQMDEQNERIKKLIEDKNEMQVEFDTKEIEFLDNIQSIEARYEQQSNELQRRNAEYLDLQNKYKVELQEISDENALLQNERARASVVEQNIQAEMLELKDFFQKHVEEQVVEDERFAKEIQQKFDDENDGNHGKKKRKKKKMKGSNSGSNVSNDDYKDNSEYDSDFSTDDDETQALHMMDDVVNDAMVEREQQMDKQSQMLIKQIEDENNREILRRKQMEEQAKLDAIFARDMFLQMKQKNKSDNENKQQSVSVSEALQEENDQNRFGMNMNNIYQYQYGNSGGIQVFDSSSDEVPL